MMCHMLWVLALLSGGRGTRSMPQLALVHHQQLQLRQPARLSLLLRRAGRLHSGINKMMKALRKACVCTNSLWPASPVDCKTQADLLRRLLGLASGFAAGLVRLCAVCLWKWGRLHCAIILQQLRRTSMFLTVDIGQQGMQSY